MLVNLIRYYFQNALKILQNPKFWYARLCFYVFYLGKRPFALSHNSLNPSLTYGETPYAVFETIARYLRFNDRFLDLGSGRGLGLFYLASIVEARFLGVELIKEYVDLASKIAQLSRYQNIQFMEKDLATYRLPACDAIFLAGTCYDDELLQKICREISNVKPRYVFSISTSLTEYGLTSYEIEDVPIYMPWGQTSLYVLSSKQT